MNRPNLIIAAFAFLTLGAGAGCWLPIPFGEHPYPYEGVMEPAINVTEDGELAGAFGSFERDQPTDAEVTSYGDYGGAVVEVISADSRGAGMLQLNVSGDLEDIPSGTSRTFTIDGDGYDGGLFVSATGCAGDTSDEWLEDELATEVTVTVTDLEGHDGTVREYAFEALFPTYTNTWDVEGTTALTARFLVSHVAL